MTFKNFTEFRSQIIELEDTFNRLDPEGSETLDSKQIVHMLAEFGICTGLTSRDAKLQVEVELLQFLDEVGTGERRRYRDYVRKATVETVHGITFPWFLMFVKNLRKRNCDSQM